MNPSIQLFLAELTTEPGVYRMVDRQGVVLYVGKASNLKKRVSSYFLQNVTTKTRALVRQIATIEVTITRSETEALLLESNLIKSLRPKYNVLMRDDKSYPFIHISKHPFARIEILRSKHKPHHGDFFGPYPSVSAVRQTLNLIQKIFKIRHCTDSYYSARSRPCLQFQIKRCSAPCTQQITGPDYQQALNDARLFLQGKSQQIIQQLEIRMQEAVKKRAYEEAALLRDQIKNIRHVQEQQGVIYVNGDADILAIEARPGFAAVQWVSVREGEVLGSDCYFPNVPSVRLDDAETTLWQQVLSAFINHYYIEMPQRIPGLLLINGDVSDKAALETVLTELRGKRCKIQTRFRGPKARWVDLALNNLQLAMTKHKTSLTLIEERYTSLKELLALSEPIERMECFDISHTQGSATIASCVVFDAKGPAKRLYRQFNITDIHPGDDYAAMKQALTRRFKRLLLENNLPSLLIIDGGKGQVSVASSVFEELGIKNVKIIGIAKGPARKAGWERLILNDGQHERTLPADSKALHLLQHIRDEAHRFAVRAHRNKRHNMVFSSSLNSIEGIGPKRRQALLQRFGGIRELSKASIDEIAKVAGISQALALKIYQHFRS